MNAAPQAWRAAIALFALWVAGTWLMEGRVGTLLRPDAVQARLAYALVVNLLLGTVGGLLLLRHLLRHRWLDAGDAGLGGGTRTGLAIAFAFASGSALWVVQGFPATNGAVIANAFSQVLVVSAAEVIVCWTLVGASVRAALQPRLGPLATWLAGAVAAALFGLYHFAHSPPFNTWPMVATLTATGFAVSAFFFISRDTAGTIVFLNFLGTFGVVRALSSAGALQDLQVLRPALLGTAGITVLAVAAGYLLLSRAPEQGFGSSNFASD